MIVRIWRHSAFVRVSDSTVSLLEPVKAFDEPQARLAGVRHVKLPQLIITDRHSFWNAHVDLDLLLLVDLQVGARDVKVSRARSIAVQPQE